MAVCAAESNQGSLETTLLDVGVGRIESQQDHLRERATASYSL